MNKTGRKYKDSELIFRYCKGLCTESEKKYIENFLNTSTKNQQLYQDFRNALALGDDIKAMEMIDVKAGYLKTQSIIKKNRYKLLKMQMVKYAAFLTVPLLMSSIMLGYLYFHQNLDEEMQYVDIRASIGAVIRYELPDNSVVWLNSGSKLRYPVSFKDDAREVDLEGEAYFEVQSDKERPFYVNTSQGIQVYVYGTQFNVSAYCDEDYVETVLESGHVSVLIPECDRPVTLVPGEYLLCDKKTLHFLKSEVDVNEKIAWKDGKLIFRNTSLDNVLKRLSRHFNVDIQFNNISGKDYRYRATFKNETLSQILDYLSKSASMKWKTEEPVQLSDGTFSRQRIIVDLY